MTRFDFTFLANPKWLLMKAFHFVSFFPEKDIVPITFNAVIFSKVDLKPQTICPWLWTVFSGLQQRGWNTHMEEQRDLAGVKSYGGGGLGA